MKQNNINLTLVKKKKKTIIGKTQINLIYI